MDPIPITVPIVLDFDLQTGLPGPLVPIESLPGVDINDPAPADTIRWTGVSWTNGRVSADEVEGLDEVLATKANASSLGSHTGRTDNPHNVTAPQTGAIPVTEKGAAFGVATLDGGGKVPSTQLFSRIMETATAITLTSPSGASAIELSDYGAGYFVGSYGIASTSINNSISGRTFIGTVLSGNPARMCEIRDSSAAQLRLTHTPGVHWADLRAISGGTLQITSSAGSAVLGVLCGTGGITLSSSASLLVDTAASSAQFRLAAASYLEATAATVQFGTAGKALGLRGHQVSFFGSGGSAQHAFISDATDAASTQALVNSLKSLLIGYGLMASV